MSHAITLTHANFDQEVVQSHVPVLVDYWAPWCGPCRVLGPVIDQIAAERAGSLKVAKVNVDQEPHLADLAGVQGIPFVVLYSDGRPAASAVGAQPERALERALGLEPAAARDDHLGAQAVADAEQLAICLGVRGARPSRRCRGASR